MTIPLLFIAAITLASAAGAVCFRNIVHCALSLALALAGIALAYLCMSAVFVGLAQLLIYIGAVAILIVFAILLTADADSRASRQWSKAWPSGVGVALAVCAVLALVIFAKGSLPEPGDTTAPSAPVVSIGRLLMSRYVLPLETAGLLLTAALIGAMVIAMRERPGSGTDGGVND